MRTQIVALARQIVAMNAETIASTKQRRTETSTKIKGREVLR
jgi:hypothetical protein